MIDFRYLLVTVIAVFLALGIGVLMGTLALGENLEEDIEDRIDRIDETNARLRGQVDELESRLAHVEKFSGEVETWLIPERLAAEPVVFVAVEDSDGDVVDDLRSEVEVAGGNVVTTMTFKTKLGLASDAERDELALAIDAVNDEGETLLSEMATRVGDLASDAAEASSGSRAWVMANRRLETVLSALEEADFVAVERSSDRGTVPAGSSFVVAGGGREEPSFDFADVAVTLSAGLAEDGAGVMVAEPSQSIWGVVRAIRRDPLTNGTVATVDQAESIAGRIALVLGLDLASRGIPDHYGTASGSSSVIPEPSP